ncbi:MAG: hypothetical protein ABMA15_12000 [Vicinamibacterales bacterium]
MLRRLVYGGLLVYTVYYFGLGALPSVSSFWKGWNDDEVGGACEAFMQGGTLEQEYLENCVDEIVTLKRSDGTTDRYHVAADVLLEATIEQRKARPGSMPSTRQLRVALMSQWGGACEFAVNEQPSLPRLEDVDRDTRIYACLAEMLRLQPRAWAALTHLHFRLKDRSYWVPEYYPTIDQLRRAMEEEHKVFGFAKSTLWAVATGLFALIAVAVVAEQAAPTVARVWRKWAEKRKDRTRFRSEDRGEPRGGPGPGERSQGKRETGSNERREWKREPGAERPRGSEAGNGSERRSEAGRGSSANSTGERPRSSPPFQSVCWRTADPRFRHLFEKHFDPAVGLYGTPAVRLRMHNHFMPIVDAKRLQTYQQLHRGILAAFHTDPPVLGGFSYAERLDIGQYVGMVFPKAKAA